MNRNSGNVSKTKKLFSEAANNSKPNRKSFQKLSESSSISSNRNSSAQSEEDVRVIYVKPQVTNPSFEEQEHVMKKLQGQVKELRHKLRILEESVDSKDYSLSTIAREKDRAIGEIRRLERSNKQLRQQLNDERNHYLEEKEKFCEEMVKYKKRMQDLKILTSGKKKNTNWNPPAPISKQSLITQQLKWQFNKEKGDFTDYRIPGVALKNSKSQKLPRMKEQKAEGLGNYSCSDSNLRKTGSLESLHLYEGDDTSLQLAALRTENAKLRSIICERDERNYELCLRFLRMKHYKNDIRTRFQDLENEYLQVIANLMDKIDEARQEFNFIIDQKFKRPLHSTNAMYLQLVQRNSKMAFENASLRLENQCLKKELNKHMNRVSEQDRKIGCLNFTNDQESKLMETDSKDEGKLKSIKKNVNFKEIRTIFERDVTFKNSDTDSNYMSKTSTTVPSNGSLADQKSNESIVETKIPNKIIPNFQANNLPNEILNKIFKRIDTSSCQSLESNEKDQVNSDKEQNRLEERKENKFTEILEKNQNKEIQSSDMKRIKDEILNQKFQKNSAQEIIEHKNSTKLLDSPPPSGSKESVKIDMKDLPPCLQNIQQKAEHSKILGQAKPEPKKLKFFRSRLKSQGVFFKSTDKDSGDGNNSLNFFTGGSEFLEKSKLDRFEKLEQITKEQETQQNHSRFRMRQITDSCGLQEKIEFSDMELPVTVDSKTQTTVDISRIIGNSRDEPEEVNPRIDILDSDDECLKGLKTVSKSLMPALGSRSRSSNKLNLQEELFEATRSQLGSDNVFWEQVPQFYSVTSKGFTKTCKTGKENSEFLNDVQIVESESPFENNSNKNKPSETHEESDVAYFRKTEGSKRFSHRLISTSPEQLKSILTESQLGACYRMAPIIVGHATTEINQAFKYHENSNEIVLQLVIPTMGQTPQTFSERGTAEKLTVEKETSISGLNPTQPTKSLNLPVEICNSDVRIPVSSLPTSSSTMDMVDSALMNDKTNILLRTLSAPGFLESTWLDPYTICEMRDCSTNT